jgi:hypothetical protein
LSVRALFSAYLDEPGFPGKEVVVKKLLVVLLVLGSASVSRADAVSDWNTTATTAAFAAGLDNEFGCVDPLHESRMLGMMHVAMHDALNAIDRRYRPYAFDGEAAPDASTEAAIAAAARDVLVAVLPELPPDIGATPARPSTSSRRPMPPRWLRSRMVPPRNKAF